MLFPVAKNAFKTNDLGYRITWRNTPMGEWSFKKMLHPQYFSSRMQYWGIRNQMLTQNLSDIIVLRVVLVAIMVGSLFRHSELAGRKFMDA